MALVNVRKKGQDSVQGDIIGQGGTVVPVNESRFDLDEPILDPNSPLAVQIPEGVGADHSRIGLGLADALREGHVEAKFEQGVAPLPTSSTSGTDQDEHVRAVGTEPEGDFEPKPVSEYVVTPDVHNKPEVERTADVKQDVEKDSPASSKE